MAQDLSPEFRRGIDRLQYCDIVHSTLNDYKDHKDPKGYRFWNKSSYLERYNLYLRNIQILKRSTVFQEFTNAIGPENAQKLFNRCEQAPQNWSQLSKELSAAFPEYQEIALRLLN